MCMRGYVGCGGVKATPKLPSTFDLQVNIAMIIALLIIIAISILIPIFSLLVLSLLLLSLLPQAEQQQVRTVAS